MNLAFIHIQKCAGTYVDSWLTRNLVPKGYRIFNPWYLTRAEIASLGRGISFSREMPKQDYRRDWSEDELLKISDFEGEKYVHNHSKNWPSKVFYEYKSKGFFTFSFLRNPIDLICSMYFFLLEKPGHPSDPAWGYEDLGTLDSFVRNNVFNLDTLLPSYYKDLDYFNIFSDKNFCHMLNLLNINDYKPMDKVNVSSNKGWEHYLNNGQLSLNSVELVKNTNIWQVYKGMI